MYSTLGALVVGGVSVVSAASLLVLSYAFLVCLNLAVVEEAAAASQSAAKRDDAPARRRLPWPVRRAPRRITATLRGAVAHLASVSLGGRPRALRLASLTRGLRTFAVYVALSAALQLLLGAALVPGVAETLAGAKDAHLLGMAEDGVGVDPHLLAVFAANLVVGAMMSRVRCAWVHETLCVARRRRNRREEEKTTTTTGGTGNGSAESSSSSSRGAVDDGADLDGVAISPAADRSSEDEEEGGEEERPALAMSRPPPQAPSTRLPRLPASLAALSTHYRRLRAHNSRPSRPLSSLVPASVRARFAGYFPPIVYPSAASSWLLLLPAARVQLAHYLYQVAALATARCVWVDGRPLGGVARQRERERAGREGGLLGKGEGVGEPWWWRAMGWDLLRCGFILAAVVALAFVFVLPAHIHRVRVEAALLLAEEGGEDVEEEKARQRRRDGGGEDGHDAAGRQVHGEDRLQTVVPLDPAISRDFDVAKETERLGLRGGILRYLLTGLVTGPPPWRFTDLDTWWRVSKLVVKAVIVCVGLGVLGVCVGGVLVTLLTA